MRLEAIEEMDLQLRRQENVVKLLRKFIEDPNAEGMGKSLNELGVRYYDIIQLLVTETNESTIYQEIVTNVLRKLDWKEEEIKTFIKSWRKEWKLHAYLKDQTTVWVNMNDQWKEAKLKKYNPEDLSWDVKFTGDEDGPISACRNYEIKINEDD